jgi:hypothetical protein
MFTQELLREEAAKVASKISQSGLDQGFFELPFKHLVCDKIFSDRLAELCLKSFPDLSDESWVFADNHAIEVKARSNWQSEFEIPEGIVDAIRILNSAPILKAMSSRFGIPKLMPDPYFTGGGLNCTPTGGLLDVHIDGNYHDASGMHRRMNALVFLNPNYQSTWGGEFGIYDDDGETLVKTIEPLHNRLVIFDSHDKSFHGLPHPINFPPNDPRRSIILYYYTVAPRPSSMVTIEEPHSALWKSTGFTDKNGHRTRNYY